MKTISLARSLKIHGNVVVLAMTATVVLVRLVPLHAQSLDCSVFVSETSLKRGGMGAFSTKFLAQDEVIETVDRLDFSSNDGLRGSILRAFLWDDEKVFLPSLGVVAQSHPLLVNVERVDNAGSTTSFRALQDIQPGEELFVDRGEEWQIKSNLTKHKEYFRLSALLSKFAAIRRNHPDLDEVYWLDLLRRFRSEVGPELSLIPRTLSELDRATKSKSGIATLELKRRWLPDEEDGVCLVPLGGRTTIIGKDLLVPIPQHTLQNDEPRFRRWCSGNPNSDFLVCSILANTASPRERMSWEGELLQYSHQDIISETLPFAPIKVVYRSNTCSDEIQKTGVGYVSIPNHLWPLFWRKDYKAGLDMMGSSTKTTNVTPLNSTCNLFLAPSSIDGAGFGVFVADEVSVGSKLESVLALLETPEVGFDGVSKGLAHDYAWNARGAEAEYESKQSGRLITNNLGALANSRPGIVSSSPRTRHDSLLDRCRDPGAGASTEYMVDFFVNRHLKAGEEVFLDYGEEWFSHRASLKDLPRKANFVEADKVVGSLAAFLEMAFLTKEQESDFISLFRSSVQSSRTRGLLEKMASMEDVKAIAVRGSTAYLNLQPARSREWLKENGFCLDALHISQSNIPQAGRGAFATRPIPSGQAVVSGTLVPTFDQRNMQIAPEVSGHNVTILKQIINYHYGHAESSALFMPLTSINAINHDHQNPNALVRFATEDPVTARLIQQPLSSLQKTLSSARLVLQVVALKDIAANEEILIDYGVAWEAAWREHVARWTSPCGDDNVSSKTVYNMNQNKFNTRFHAWTKNYLTVCLVDWSDPGLRPTSSSDALPLGWELARLVSQGWPCWIEKANPTDDSFQVLIYYQDGMLYRYDRFSAERLRFVPMPYRSDYWWPGAFRHSIAIPDDAFPAAWRDLKVN